MPRHEPAKPGAPIWLDLSSSDKPRAIEFYGSVLGWEPQHTSAEFNDYVNFLHRGEPVAGLVAAMDGQPDAWLVYLATSDADETAASVVSAGGTSLFTHPVADLGRMTVSVDPSGAPIGAWEPAAHPGFAFEREAGAPAWFELHTDDYEAAVPFYESAFGWVVDSIGDSDELRMVTTGRPPFAGIYDAKAYLAGANSRWVPYFGVADADQAAARIVKLGGTQFTPVSDTPFGRMSSVADPMGAVFSIIQSQE